MSVIYSTTCGYGIHALCRIASLQRERIAAGHGGENVGVGVICEGSELSPPFVSKILHQLARAGLILSSKGRNGGFRLGRPAHAMRLMDVVEVIDGAEVYRRCAVSSFEKCNDNQPCPQHDSFKPLREQILHYLRHTTIADLVDAMNDKQAKSRQRFEADVASSAADDGINRA